MSQNASVRFYPPSYEVRVENVAIPKIQHPDDAIVKVTLSGCVSDLLNIEYLTDQQSLHIPDYVGVICTHTEELTESMTCHEFIGHIIELGSNFGSQAVNRPSLYSTLKVGDKIVAPFTSNCGECNACRLGYTCRCSNGLLFGSPALQGGQAQYVRVPNAGSTLYNLNDPKSWPSSSLSQEKRIEALSTISDSSLLLLADIIPTGLFGALQVMSHHKVLPVLEGRPYPLSCFPALSTEGQRENLVRKEDAIATFAIVGLGPVGICICVSLLDMLASRDLPYRIVAIDPVEARRSKVKAIYSNIGADGKGNGEFVVLSAEDAKQTVAKWTDNIGCTAVLEAVGNTSALTLSYSLVRPFGVIVSVGVHSKSPIPFTGGDLYGKNVSFDFGRCPARSMFPMAFDLLVKRQDVFGGVGDDTSLVDRVVDLGQAPEMYRAFDKGEVGKVLFDPWKESQ